MRKGPEVPPGELARLTEVPGDAGRFQLKVSRPGPGESLVLVVARVLPPTVQRPAPADPVWVRVAVGRPRLGLPPARRGRN